MGNVITATVNTTTGVFLDASHVEDATHLVVVLPRNPDHLRERYTNDPKNPIRAATAQEMTDAATAASDEKAAAVLNQNLALKALALVVGDLTGKTPTQISTLVKAKYKSLSVIPS